LLSTKAILSGLIRVCPQKRNQLPRHRVLLPFVLVLSLPRKNAVSTFSRPSFRQRTSSTDRASRRPGIDVGAPNYKIVHLAISLRNARENIISYPPPCGPPHAASGPFPDSPPSSIRCLAAFAPRALATRLWSRPEPVPRIYEHPVVLDLLPGKVHPQTLVRRVEALPRPGFTPAPHYAGQSDELPVVGKSGHSQGGGAGRIIRQVCAISAPSAHSETD